MRNLFLLSILIFVHSAVAVTTEAVKSAIVSTAANRDFVLPSDSRFQRKWSNFVAATSSYSPTHDIKQAFALVDCTIMGGGEDGMLIDSLGVTIHNGELSSGSNGFISWADLASSGQAVAEGQYNVSICSSPHISITLSGSDFKQGDMIALVSKLISASKVNPLTKEDMLLAAISSRNYESVKEIIERGFGSLNCALPGHWSPMSKAVALNAVNIMKLLKEYGATIDYCIPGYWDNLQTACNNKAYDAVRYLVGECQMPIGNNLVEAAQKGDLWLVKYFVSECHADGAKALDAARSKNQRAVIEWLEPIVRESAAQARTIFEKQLMAAIRAKDAARVASLVNGTRYDLNFEEKMGKGTWTPLTYAASIGNNAIIKSLIDAGADAQHVDSDKNTPIDQAAWSGQLETVKCLSDYIKDLGCAAIFAARNGQLTVIKWFVEEKGVSPNFVNHDESKTCTGVLLAEAACRGKLDVCKYLISKGAVIDYHPQAPKGGYKYSALERAAQNGQLNAVRFLAEEHSAKLCGALDLAKKNKHQDVVTYLEAQYAGELKARKEAAEALARAKAEAERKRKAEEEARAKALAAKKAREDRVLSDYRSLKQRLGEFPGASEHSTTEEWWSRELVKGLDDVKQKYFSDSVKASFASVVSSAKTLLQAVRQEEDLLQEASETKKKLVARKRQVDNEAGNRALIGLFQAAGGDKSSGRSNFFGGIMEGAQQEQKINVAISEVERCVENAHRKVLRAYAIYQDSAEIFEKRALRQVSE